MKNLFSRKAINFCISSSSSSSSGLTIKGLSRIHPPPPPPNSSRTSTITTWVSPLTRPLFSLYINPFPLSHRFIHSSPGPAISSKNGFGIGIEQSKDVLVNDMLSPPKLDECKDRILDIFEAACDQVTYGRPGGNRWSIDADRPSEPLETLTENVMDTAWKVANEIIKDMPLAKTKDEIKTSCQFQDFEWIPPLSYDSESWTRFRESQMLMHMKKEKLNSYPMAEDFCDFVDYPSGLGLSGKTQRDLMFGWLLWKIAECKVHTQEEDQSQEAGNREHETRNQLGFLNVSTNVDKEAKSVSEKRKLVTEKILSLYEDTSLPQLLVEWIKQLLPRKIDWFDLLDRLLKQQNMRIYVKVAELVLPKESLEASVQDCSKLTGSHATPNHLEYTERVLRKMNEKGILTEILTLETLIHIYCEAEDLGRAEQAFEILRNRGFRPDTRVINSMLMAYVSMGKTQLAESLIIEMGSRPDIELTKEMYMTLVWSFAQSGDVAGVIRIANAMEDAVFHLSLGSCYTFLVDADDRGGDLVIARKYFHDINELKQTTSELSKIMACEKEKLLDKGSKILLQFEEDGYEHSVATYFVLVALSDRLHAVEKTEKLLWELSCESSKSAK